MNAAIATRRRALVTPVAAIMCTLGFVDRGNPPITRLFIGTDFPAVKA